jgi:hypothetical protein
VAAGPSETLQGILEALELCMPCIPVTLCRCLRSPVQIRVSARDG